ncbi:MAG: pyridoxamine 5'-phosphate oxidase family protein [Chloroflexota bacterium]|nr:pyridoxamine 5'-phosphate oxidase family protein [Chloroflexota bacterium]
MSATATITSHAASFDVDRQRAIAQKAIAKQSFGTLATSSSANVPHVVGVRYAVVDGALYVTMFDDSIKARNIRTNPRVAVCIPARKIPMFPPFAVQFQGRADLLPKDDPEIVRLFEAGAFKRIISNKDFEAPHTCFARIVPSRRVSTYGLGVPLLQIVREPTSAIRSVDL